MTIDGKVSSLNRPVFEALQKVKNPKDMSVDESKALRSAIMQDGKIDAAELDLMQELTKDNNQVQISAQPGAGFNPGEITLGAAKGVAKDKLNLLLSPPNLNSLWDGGPEGIKKMADLYSISPMTRERVSQFLSTKFEASWNASTVMNAYSPMVGSIAKAYNAVNGDPEANNPGRNMIHDSIEKLNARMTAANKSTLPSFLYNWIRPGGMF